MKHKVKVSVSNKPQTGNVITCRSVTIRERILRFFIGDKRKITVLIPGDRVGEIDICEAERGGEDSGQGKIEESS